MHDLILWLIETIGSLGYLGIFLLMAMESSIFPVPSELVMPPAGYLAAQGRMQLWLVIVCGTAGSLAGAYANYFLAKYLGRPVLLRYGRYMGITAEKFARVEQFFLRHGEISTFIGRLIPVVRHLISLPAGLANMNHWRFSLYTTLGAGLWCIILALLGYIFQENQERILQYSQQILGILCALCFICLLLYIRKNKSAKCTAPE